MEDQFNQETGDQVNVKKPSLLGMIMNPKEQLTRIRDNPLILGALIIISFIFVVGTVLQMININPSTVLDDELAGILDPGDEKIVLILTLFGSGLAALFMPVIIILISSFIYWVVAKLVKSKVTFKQLFSMSTYILFINSLGILINGLLTMLISSNASGLFTSLGSLVPSGTMFSSILSSFELFGIWALILTAIGLQIVANFSKAAAWTVTILFFTIGIVFSMVGVAFEMLIGSF